MLSFGLQIPLFFLINILILFGPLLFFGLKQMKGYEPGDADWGVKLEDVRGQAEPKAEVTKVIELWSAGEEFRKAGGKPERGLLFIGAPGTGKTMLSKGIATSFNSPIVTMPGSGFAQTFIGMDVVIVMFLIRKARKLARKWGEHVHDLHRRDRRGRHAPPGAAGRLRLPPEATRLRGAADVRPVGLADPDRRPHPREPPVARPDVQSRAEPRRVAPRPARRRARPHPGRHVPGHGRHGRRARAQPAAGADGRRRRAAVHAQVLHQPHQHVPRRDLPRPAAHPQAALRIKPPKPRPEQVYFIGATNVPLEALDPALIRPGAWAATSGSARRRRTTARTSSTSTWTASATTRTSTATSAATSWRA
jgi:hypothetical protein